MSLGAS